MSTSRSSLFSLTSARSLTHDHTNTFFSSFLVSRFRNSENSEKRTEEGRRGQGQEKEELRRKEGIYR